MGSHAGVFAACAAALLAVLAALAPRAEAHGRHDHGAHHGAPAAAAGLAAPGTRAPYAAPTRIYIANDDHTDYMWSGDEADYRAAILTMLDYYIAQAETTAWRPSDFRGRFNADGTLWLWEYERSRSPADFQRLIQLVRDGAITVPMNLLIHLYGAMPMEAVIRSFSYAGRLERRENLRFPLVVPMEDQTLPGGVASLFAGCGARYCWKGICGCSSRIDAGDRPRDIYHFAGPDGQSLLMKWHPMYQGNQSLGGYAEARDPLAAVEFIRTDTTFLSRWPYQVASAFGYGWDDLLTTTHAFIDAAVTASDPANRVIVSNQVDFFEDFAATHGAELEHYGACYGNEWDLYTASIGEVTARMKRAVEGLRTAEALAAIAVRFDPGLWDSRVADRDSAMLACGLYYEHCIGPGPGVTEAERNAWQRRIEATMTAYTDELRSAAAAAIAQRVEQPAGAERHVVFNPLSWTRDGAVDLAAATPEPRHVVDVTSGAELPSQTVAPGGQPRLRVAVSGVPPVGYRVVEVRPGAGAAFPPAAAVTLPAMDNGLVRVALGTRGQIVSLLDHTDANFELVAPGFALNDIGAGAGTGAVTLESSGPVSATLKVSTGAPLTRDTRVTLFAGSRRVEVQNEIRQNFGDDDVGYASRFNLAGMVMRHEEVGMIARVGRLAQGGDYANENTRTDGLTLNHFVDLSLPARGVTLSAWDSPFFRAGGSTPWTLDATTPAVRPVVGNLVDGYAAGISGQGGDSYFLNRFAFGAHGPWDAAAAMRFALEHQNPLFGFAAAGPAGAPLPSSSFSALTLDSPDVILWALKPAEDGADQGLIARVWNLADAPRSATLALPGTGIAQARATTHIETEIGPVVMADGAVPMTLARQQLRTFRLTPPNPNAAVDPAAAPAALAIWPNPLRAGGSGATIAFRLARAGTVRLTVHDVRGRRVASRAEDFRAAGRHQLTWSVPAGGLAPGLYFATLETDGGRARGRIVVLD